MNNKLSVAELPINASPVAVHRRQMRIQVWLPLAVSILIILVLMILTIISAIQGSPQIEWWGNISAIIVILPVLLILFIFLAITGAIVYGMTKLLNRVPDWMLRLQLIFERLSLSVRRASDSATKPVFTVNGFSSRVRAFWKSVSQ